MADGTVTIDLNLNTDSITSDVDAIKDIFKSFGADVDTATIEQKFNDAFNRVENKAEIFSRVSVQMLTQQPLNKNSMMHLIVLKIRQMLQLMLLMISLLVSKLTQTMPP